MTDGKAAAGPGGARYASAAEKKRLGKRKQSLTRGDSKHRESSGKLSEGSVRVLSQGIERGPPETSARVPDVERGPSSRRGKGMGRESARARPIEHYRDHMQEHGDMKTKRKPSKKTLVKAGSKRATRPPSGRRRKVPETDARMAARAYVFALAGSFFLCTKPQSVSVDIAAGTPALALYLLNLSEGQVRVIWDLFQRNTCGDGSISHNDFFDALQLDPTPFLKSLLDTIVFDWADLDHDRNLTFSEFLLAATVVCTLTPRELSFFVFSLFDTDGDERLDYAELKAISRAVSGAQSNFGGNSANFLSVCDSLNTKKGLSQSSITFDDFLEVARRCPLVCHPAQLLQDLFRAKTLGKAAWDGLAGKFAESVDARRGEFHTQMRDAGLAIMAESAGNDVRRSTLLG